MRANGSKTEITRKITQSADAADLQKGMSFATTVIPTFSALPHASNAADRTMTTAGLTRWNRGTAYVPATGSSLAWPGKNILANRAFLSRHTKLFQIEFGHSET